MSKELPTVNEIAPVVERVFKTRDGELLLSYLERRYYDATIKSDEALRGLGRRDVVHDLKRMMEKKHVSKKPEQKVGA